ncbi:AT-hook motif nuclear-localized protein 1 [Striga hermonthica]|uniref:AT-hook motif nuclear-localized protein n=1 Tax=Striga hermonthica TaxID=68872 RepID=A0A9N7RLQ9_STRHE|nr:AT-hook motif nuclear-localized protein 1 [Striga hermonthica]
MEEKDGLNGSGFRLKGDEAPQSYRVEPSDENPGIQSGGSTAPPPPVAPSPNAADPSTELKKKRGRPKKRSGDGSAAALSPMPISASIPFTGDYSSAWKNSASRPVDTFKKKHKLEFENQGQPVACSFSGSFIPHMLTVNSGEDIMMKIISFSQQGSRAICILAANGTISNVTIRQANSSGGTLTYEGRFEILSLTGSFMPSDNGMTKSRSGGLSVSLAGPDGRVLGGGLAGMLVAAGPVQSEDDRNRVLNGGPWLFNKKVISLINPQGAGALSAMDFHTIPFWVHFLNLPLACHMEQCVRLVGQHLGEIIDVDTEGITPRAKVKIDISKPLRRRLRVYLEAHWMKNILFLSNMRSYRIFASTATYSGIGCASVQKRWMVNPLKLTASMGTGCMLYFLSSDKSRGGQIFFRLIQLVLNTQATPV